MTERELGKIEKATIEYEDHGILTAFIGIDFGTSYQSFGGYSLDNWNEAEQRRIGTAAGMDFIMGIMDAVGVNSWGDLIGKEVWVEREPKDGAFGRIVSIESPPYRKHTRPFRIEEWQARWTGEDGKIKG